MEKLRSLFFEDIELSIINPSLKPVIKKHLGSKSLKKFNNQSLKAFNNQSLKHLTIKIIKNI